MKWLQAVRLLSESQVKLSASGSSIFASRPTCVSVLSAKESWQSVIFARAKSDFAQAAQPSSERPAPVTAYSKDYAYLPSWREVPDVNLVSVADQEEYLEVVFGSSSAGSDTSHDVCNFSYDWLRDVCRCDECFNNVTHNKQTAIQLQSPKPKSVGISEDGDSVEISWIAGHNSRYPKKLLIIQHQQDKQPRGNDHVIDAKRQLWGSDLPEILFRKYVELHNSTKTVTVTNTVTAVLPPDTDISREVYVYEFESLISDDRSLYGWLMDLREIGFTVIKNAPRKPGQLTELCSRVAYPRYMCWGPTFQVEVKENASHVAFSNHPLPLHTDSAYYMFPAGVQLLHCIKQSSDGGESHVADGFRAAESIRKTDPECFDLLTKIEWEYFDMGDDYLGAHHLQARHPVIRVDGSGRLQQIVYSDHSRGYRQDNATSVAPTAYNALRKYFRYLNAEDSVLKYTLKDGDILVVDNFRVLHGRSKIGAGARHLEGAYLDWDEICSKLRSVGRALF